MPHNHAANNHYYKTQEMEKILSFHKISLCQKPSFNKEAQITIFKGLNI